MARISARNFLKLAAVPILACAACCVSLVVPIIVAITGLGVVGVGYGMAGGLIVLAAIAYALYRRNQACAPASDCCAK